MLVGNLLSQFDNPAVLDVRMGESADPRASMGAMGAMGERTVVTFSKNTFQLSAEWEGWKWQSAKWDYIASRLALIGLSVFVWFAVFTTHGTSSLLYTVTAFAVTVSLIPAYKSARAIGKEYYRIIKESISREREICKVLEKDLKGLRDTGVILERLTDLPEDVKTIYRDTIGTGELSLAQAKWLAARLKWDYEELRRKDDFDSEEACLGRAKGLLERLQKVDVSGKTEFTRNYLNFYRVEQKVSEAWLRWFPKSRISSESEGSGREAEEKSTSKRTAHQKDKDLRLAALHLAEAFDPVEDPIEEPHRRDHRSPMESGSSTRSFRSPVSKARRTTRKGEESGYNEEYERGVASRSSSSSRDGYVGSSKTRSHRRHPTTVRHYRFVGDDRTRTTSSSSQGSIYRESRQTNFHLGEDRGGSHRSSRRRGDDLYY